MKTAKEFRSLIFREGGPAMGPENEALAAEIIEAMEIRERQVEAHRAAMGVWEELLKAVDNCRQYVPDPQIVPLYERWRAARAKLEELKR